MHIQLCKVLKDIDSMYVFLLQNLLNSFGCLKMLEDDKEVFLESLIEEVDSEF